MYINGKKVVIKVVPNVGIRIVPAEEVKKFAGASGQAKRFPVSAVSGKVLQRLAFFPGPVIISSKLMMDLLQLALNARI